jgi:hypothetical protein
LNGTRREYVNDHTLVQKRDSKIAQTNTKEDRSFYSSTGNNVDHVDAWTAMGAGIQGLGKEKRSEKRG